MGEWIFNMKNKSDILFYLDNRKKAVIFGNCQTVFIKEYLRNSKDFNSQYIIYDTSFIFDFPPSGLDEKLLLTCDLFIYHEVGPSFGLKLSTDYILSKLSEKCERVIIPNAHFTGYHPQHIYGQENKKETKYPYGRFPYGDQNINRLVNKKSSEEIVKILCDENYYTYQQVKQNVENSLEELSKREKGLNIRISNYIEEKYKNNYLFYTVNHPSWV